MTDDPGNADVPVGQSKPTTTGDANHFGHWYSRGYLPHHNHPGAFQSITFRLADSLPRNKLAELKAELTELPETKREIIRRKKIEEWLDAGMGCCALGHPEVARVAQDSLLHFNGIRYHLHAWCIMPNHVHVLVQAISDLAKIVQGWKSVTSRWALRHNESLRLKIPERRLWMRDYWDRDIRNEEHFANTVSYFHRNPVSAGLCQSPEQWPWSSAFPGNADVLVGSPP